MKPQSEGHAFHWGDFLSPLLQASKTTLSHPDFAQRPHHCWQFTMRREEVEAVARFPPWFTFECLD